MMAQEDTGDTRDFKTVSIKKASRPIVLDGRLDEEDWKEAGVADHFRQKYPQDGREAQQRTEVRLTYDSNFLYVGAVCYDSEEYVVQTLKRDARFFDGDSFAVVLDPVNRRTNGFLFGVSPYNVQAEDILSQSSFGHLNFSWDQKWFSEVTRYKDHWVVEMAIPFKTLRFKAGTTHWGINFFRNDEGENVRDTWTPVPINFRSYDLGYTGTLEWDSPPPRTGTNIALIPYVSSSLYRDKEQEPPKDTNTLDAGFDAKVGLTSSLNLDLTVNPDFSQVDVDVQQTNLTRFDLNFPERRGFFLENYDLFANFGTPPARPIFTRRMGLDENAEPVPIIYGARLSGNLSKSSRIGLLNLQTKPEAGNPGQNYTIATFNQSLLERSVIKAYVTNRQAVVKGEGFDYEDYGRNAGLEFNYLNLSGRWRVFTALHASSKPDIGLGTFRNAGFEYDSRHWNFFVDYFGIDTDYYADIGFIPRMENYDAAKDTTVHLGFEHYFGRAGYTFRPPAGSAVISHQLNLQNMMDFTPEYTLKERSSTVEYEMNFRDTGRLDVNLEDNETKLLFATSFTDNEPLQPGHYHYPRATVRYRSDERKEFAYEAEVETGAFYNGSLNRVSAGITYRRQPWGNFNLALDQNFLRLPDPAGDMDLVLINQQTEINFSNKLFWTTFLQYNTQQDNLNINSKLQWRFLPMSDIYLVYTDNYFSSPFLQSNKNRGIVFKINYWLTL